jgi:carboxypeptidase Taq
MTTKYETLNTHLSRIIDLKMAASVLQWDEEVYMPERGLTARSEQIATLSSFAHELLTSNETERILSNAERETSALPYDSDEASMTRITRREFNQSTRIPSEIVAEQSRLASQSFSAWKSARENNDYSIFSPFLKKTIELNRRIAGLLGFKEHPYDALLDIYEPGMKKSDIEILFNKLKEGLLPIYKKIISSRIFFDDIFLNREFDEKKQFDFSIEILKAIGFDFSRGRQDISAHPFTTNFSVDDVRVTNRFSKTLPLSSIFSAIHEGGHALYEQGVSRKFDRTSLMGGATLGLHESQSRLWENIIGRSLPFWKKYYPLYQEYFPEQMNNVSLEDFLRAMNRVSPGFIRVEADEVTYNFHVFVRFEIESALISGDLEVTDIPAYWNEKYYEYLGITPRNDSEGCLQDIHWSHGSFGYFPTYTIGNIISAQLYDQLLKELNSLESQIALGDFLPLLGWLREKVHIHGKKFTSPELVKKITGTDIDSCYFIEYLNKKYSEIYGY